MQQKSAALCAGHIAGRNHLSLTRSAMTRREGVGRTGSDVEQTSRCPISVRKWFVEQEPGQGDHAGELIYTTTAGGDFMVDCQQGRRPHTAKNAAV